MATQTTIAVCPKCLGQGVLDEKDGKPWKRWDPLHSLAISKGTAKPINCPDCKRTGQITIEQEIPETQQTE